jgi:hypothetical protein
MKVSVYDLLMRDAQLPGNAASIRASTHSAGQAQQQEGRKRNESAPPLLLAAPRERLAAISANVSCREGAGWRYRH